MQIIVLGMHRAGTSAVTRLINMMGAYLGPNNLLMPASSDNPKGYWERVDIQPVSYTHLDVYKRQERGCTACPDTGNEAGTNRFAYVDWP